MMRSIVKWAIDNPPATNTLVVAVLVWGAICAGSMRREFWPYSALDVVEVSVEYRGASPEEVAEGVNQRIEESVRSVHSVRRITSVAREGSGVVSIELAADVVEADVQEILGEIRSRVDGIPSLPALAERPIIERRQPRTTALQVGVVGPDDDSVESRIRLRDVAERVREELLLLPELSQAELVGAPRFQIDIELSEDVLRKYGVSLSDVADIVRDENVEIPSGTLRTASQDILLRGSNRSAVGADIERIPVVTTPDGTVLTLGDIGTVRDEFADDTAISRINGRPGVAIQIDTTDTEDLVDVGHAVRAFVAEHPLPDGYELSTFRDRTIDVEARLSLLVKNGWQGFLLVFLLLTLFLDIRLAMWVSFGIPLSAAGACIVMYYTGQTLNMTSMFAFLIALGIIVDDAIVIGENVHAHRQMGKSPRRAAIDGTLEVMPSVTTSVLTTMVAFLPMLYMTGTLAKFTAVMPFAVISLLTFSLIEACTVLPSHLAHEEGTFLKVVKWLLGPFRLLGGFVVAVNAFIARCLFAFIDRLYLPTLSAAIRFPGLVVGLSVGLLLVAFGILRSGVVPYIVLPRIDSNFCTVVVAFPDGTPERVAVEATHRLEAAIDTINQQSIEEGFTNEESGIVEAVHRSVGYGANTYGAVSQGSHVGSLTVQLVDTSKRDITSQQIVQRWRRMVGEFSGADFVSFGSGPRGIAAPPIEFSLLARDRDVAELEAAVERCVASLEGFRGVHDITAGGRPGKWEYRLTIRDEARSMGVSLAELSDTIRSSYYGTEVTRLQRGRHEVELRVRYPEHLRESLASFEDIRVRTSDGSERPLTEIAHVDVQRSYSMIHRLDQMRSITITADVEEDVGNAYEITRDLQATLVPELAERLPGIRIRWEGQQEQTNESMSSMLYGFIGVVIGMYFLFTVEFKSYLQPLIILSIIPFGMIGAIFGHIVMGQSFTLFSVYGVVALAGIVVNDSIVMIDFVNRRIEDGLSLEEAILDAGRRRCRPVLLTSITTIGGMLPILLETSRQAQVLIPMATSLCFGLLFATVLVLILAPVFFLIAARIQTLPGLLDAPDDEPEAPPVDPSSHPGTLAGSTE